MFSAHRILAGAMAVYDIALKRNREAGNGVIMMRKRALLLGTWSGALLRLHRYREARRRTWKASPLFARRKIIRPKSFRSTVKPMFISPGQIIWPRPDPWGKIYHRRKPSCLLIPEAVIAPFSRC